MSENEIRNRINARVDNIFKKEELKRIQKEAEKNAEIDYDNSYEVQKEKDY